MMKLQRSVDAKQLAESTRSQGGHVEGTKGSMLSSKLLQTPAAMQVKASTFQSKHVK